MLDGIDVFGVPVYAILSDHPAPQALPPIAILIPDVFTLVTGWQWRLTLAATFEHISRPCDVTASGPNLVQIFLIPSDTDPDLALMGLSASQPAAQIIDADRLSLVASQWHVFVHCRSPLCDA